jgi:hypothetical protein
MGKAVRWKAAIERKLWAISPRLNVSLMYLKNRGALPKLRKPENLSEFILGQIVDGELEQFSHYVDKLAVREFLESLGYGSHLPELYGVWSEPEEIDFNELPNSFALKTNHGCGSHWFCRDKKELREEEARAAMSAALATRPSPTEPQYRGIGPLCFAEELIHDTRGGGQPLDYKFMTFGGHVRGILLVGERDTGTRLALYDPAWTPIPGTIMPRWEMQMAHPRPPQLDDMLQMAREISAHFPQVRVDMYALSSGQILLGELTFTPQGGYMRYFTEKALRLLGPVGTVGMGASE